MTKKEKVKNFVKENKKEIIVYSVYGVYGVFAGIGMAHTFECIHNRITLRKMQKNTDMIDIPNLTVKDFGKVGEKIVSYYDGLLSKDAPIKSWNVVIPTEEFKKK